MFENVDIQHTHLRSIEAYLYYKLANETKGSGELIKGWLKQQQPDSGIQDTCTHCPSAFIGLTVPEQISTKMFTRICDRMNLIPKEVNLWEFS